MRDRIISRLMDTGRLDEIIEMCHIRPCDEPLAEFIVELVNLTIDEVDNEGVAWTYANDISA